MATETQSLKVGSFIAVNIPATSRVKLLEIRRITKTQYVCENDIRFRKTDLSAVGDMGLNGRIPTDADMLNIKIQRVTNLLKNVSVTPMNVDFIEDFVCSLNMTDTL